MGATVLMCTDDIDVKHHFAMTKDKSGVIGRTFIDKEDRSILMGAIGW